jgi:hypothetical protein
MNLNKTFDKTSKLSTEHTKTPNALRQSIITAKSKIERGKESSFDDFSFI